MGDWELLQRHVAGDTAALEELVRRHLDLVHGAARRQVGGTDAEDVTQAVFILLAQKARRIPHRGSLVGWLYRATRYCCSNLRKTEGRRRRHEHEAAMRSEAITDSSAQLTELLDAAMEHLGKTEREAVLLRYLEEKTFGQTGQELGISEEAARKRAERGLEKLRRHFAGQGYAVPTAAVLGVLAAEAARPAPAALAGAVMAGAQGAASSATAAAIAKGAADMMIWMKAKLVAAACAVVMLAAGGSVLVVGQVGTADRATTRATPSVQEGAGRAVAAAPQVAAATFTPGPAVSAEELATLLGVHVWKFSVATPAAGQAVTIRLMCREKGAQPRTFGPGLTTPVLPGVGPDVLLAVIPIGGGTIYEADTVRVVVSGLGSFASSTADNPLKGLAIGAIHQGVPAAGPDNSLPLIGGFRGDTVSAVANGDVVISLSVEREKQP